MDQASELRSIVAGFLEVDAASIGPATELGGRALSTSLARAGLDAALRRRLGVKSPSVYTARRYGELEAAVCGGDAVSADPPDQRTAPAAAVPSRISVPETGAGGVRCGIDIEEIEALPEASDYWEHEFYRASFTDAEIAYCSAQSWPREHFAARWAAKEAVRKLGPEYLGVESGDLEVGRDDNGAPRMTLRGSPLPVAVSLTHAGAIAVAIAVSAPPAKDVAEKAPDGPAASAEADSRSGRRPARSSRLGRLLLPLSTTIALAAAVWALLRTFG
ncbi:MAG TPA: 4'-phosphopantetheinyl transferase superfamily protein [Gammaproteobacteria bacterium]|nr:4'-phosphopantetheinyl transferase superfamily protein [Gammaproteobacteria bacterium]